MKITTKRTLISLLFSVLFLLSLNFFLSYKGYVNDIFGRTKLQSELIVAIIFLVLGMIMLIIYIFISHDNLPSPNKKTIFKEENIFNIEKKYKKYEDIENIDFVKTKYKHFNFIYKDYIVLFNIKKMSLNILEEIENEILNFKKENELNIIKVCVLYIVCILDKASPQLSDNLKVKVLEYGNRGTVSAIVIPVIIEKEEENIISSYPECKSLQEMNAFIKIRNRLLYYMQDIDLIKIKKNNNK